MIARPTTTSAAATTSTRKTNIQPSTEFRKCANAMNERLTALSISSMDMNITSGLRRTSTPIAPMVKSSALTMRYAVTGMVRSPYLLLAHEAAAHHHRAQHRDHQQHARDLEGKREAMEERLTERLGVAEARHRLRQSVEASHFGVRGQRTVEQRNNQPARQNDAQTHARAPLPAQPIRPADATALGREHRHDEKEEHHYRPGI